MPRQRIKPISMLLTVSICTVTSVLAGIKDTSAETRERLLIFANRVALLRSHLRHLSFIILTEPFRRLNAALARKLCSFEFSAI